MTAMLVSPAKHLTEWKNVFPDFATLDGSCLFIKKLIAVSLSAITYIRGVFPERAYGDKNLSGIKLKILRDDSGIKSVAKFIDLVRNCYDAVEKKYLQQMSIGIVPNPENREEVMELYNLVFHYTDDDHSISCQNEKNSFSSSRGDPVKQATFLMLKNICAISDMLEVLPKNPYITMKLFYYDDVTPPDYEPVGFTPCHKANFEFTSKTMKIQLGKIDTNNHGYKLYLKTTLGKNLMVQNSEKALLNTSQSSAGYKSSNGIEPDDHNSSQRSRSSKVTSKESPKNALECPCNCKTEDLTDTIICVSCGSRQHKVCYGILKPNDMPDVFYCVNCIVLNSNRSMNLDMIYTYQEKDIRQKLCIVRRALTLCLVSKIVHSTIFEKKLGCSKTDASVLIECLESEEFIEKRGKNKYSVIKSNITDVGFNTYFPIKDKENVSTSNYPEGMDGIFDDNVSKENIYASNHISELPETDIESSINQVQSLSLHSLSPGMRNSHLQERVSEKGEAGNMNNITRKRKLSRTCVSPDNSEELFQSLSLKRSKSQKRR